MIDLISLRDLSLAYLYLSISSLCLPIYVPETIQKITVRLIVTITPKRKKYMLEPMHLILATTSTRPQRLKAIPRGRKQAKYTVWTLSLQNRSFKYTISNHLETNSKRNERTSHIGTSTLHSVVVRKK